MGGGAGSAHGGVGSIYKLLVGVTWLKSSLVRPRCRWENNNKLNFQEVRWWGICWIDLDQDRDRWQACVKKVMNHKILGISWLAEVLLASEKGSAGVRKYGCVVYISQETFTRLGSHTSLLVCLWKHFVANTTLFFHYRSYRTAMRMLGRWNAWKKFWFSAGNCIFQVRLKQFLSFQVRDGSSGKVNSHRLCGEEMKVNCLFGRSSLESKYTCSSSQTSWSSQKRKGKYITIFVLKSINWNSFFLCSFDSLLQLFYICVFSDTIMAHMLNTLSC